MDLVGIEPEKHWAVMRDLADHADKGSWDSLWVYDHFHTVPVPTAEATHEAWSLMAAYAATTSRIKLGQMCTAMSYRNPVYLAKVAATADIISGGRIQMGIGGGWYEHEWRAYGYGFPSAGMRLGRLDEGVQIMRDAWRDGKVSFEGKHYQVDGAIVAPKPLQDNGIPLWIAGGGEKVTLRIAAQYAQYTNFTPEPEAFAHKSDVLAEHCRNVGTDFDAIVRSVNVNAIVGASEADVKDRLQRVRDRLVGYVRRGGGRCDDRRHQRAGLGDGHTGTGDRAAHQDPRPRVRVRHLLFPRGRLRPLRHRAVRTRGHARAELDRALDVAGGVPGLDRGCGQQGRKLRQLAFAGAKGAVGLVVLDRLPDFVDEPVRLVVLVDQHVGADVAVERPSVLQRPAHQLAPRGDLVGLEPELKYHRDRHSAQHIFGAPAHRWPGLPPVE